MKRQWSINKRRVGALMLGAASVVVLSGGVASAWYMVWPVIASSVSEPEIYYPSLPVSTDREDNIFAVDKSLPKKIYPPLTLVDETASDGDWIRIPSIGVAVPLVMSKTMADEDVMATLDVGAALYPNGIQPGRPGNVFIAAHSTGEPWKGKYRFAFLRINELTSHNLIHVDYQKTRYTYRIVETRIIWPDKEQQIQAEGLIPKVTLMACWPLWSTKQRMLVTGELANVTKLTPTPQ